MNQLKQLLFLSTFLAINVIVHAQVPQQINYQAVARNAGGGIIISTPISLRFTIHDGSTSGAIQYQETQNVTTNTYGLFSLQIGSGAITSGAMSAVSWSTGNKYLQVEIDPTGGSSYVDMGTQQLVSVPYALYAANAGNPLGWNLSGNAGISATANFLGTTDLNAIKFRVNDQWAGEINPTTGNSFFGIKAGEGNTTGYSNVAVGINSLYSNTTISNLVAIGDSALYSQSGGYGLNVAVGSKALFANTSGDQNTATGLQSLYSNTTGWENTATGTYNLWANTTGYRNTATGNGSLGYNTTGNWNTASGEQSLYFNRTGNNNTASGFTSSFSVTTGNNNTSMGSNSLYSDTSGNNNTAIGTNSLFTDTAGGNNTALGYNADVSSGSLTNAMALGNGATVNASNKVVIGNSSVTVIGGFSNWTNLSDGRFKTQIKENVPGLDFILKLRPVTYHLEARKFERFIGRPDSLIRKSSSSYDLAEKQVRTGFIAQEVEKAANELGYDFSGIQKPTNERDNYSLAYAEFTVPLVKAVQEQQKTIQEQQANIVELQKQVATLIKQMQNARNSK